MVDLHDLLTPDGITASLKATNKKDALQELAAASGALRRSSRTDG